MAGNKAKSPASTRDTLVKVRAHISDVEARLKSADKSTQRSVKALETTFDALSHKVGEGQSGDLKSHMDELAAHLTRRMDESRAQINAELSSALDGADINAVREALSRATARLSAAELRQAESIQKVNEQIIRLATAIDNRVRNETREREALEHRMKAGFETVQRQADTRISAVEDSSAAAFGKIGSQIAQLSSELTEARSAIEKRTEGRIYEAALDSRHEIENLKADLEHRFAGAGASQAPVDITPVQRSVAAVAARLDSLEQTLLNQARFAADDAPAFSPEKTPEFISEFKPAAITPAADLSAPPFPDAEPAPATEFEQGTYPHIPFTGAQDDAAQLDNPAAGHAGAQMALHDYDAPQMPQASDYDLPQYNADTLASSHTGPGDFDPYGAPQAPDYSADILQAVPAGNPYAQNPYADNPYGNPGEAQNPPQMQPQTPAYGGQENPYAPPGQLSPAHYEEPLDLGADMSMAAARPGGETKTSRKKAKVKAAKTPRASGASITPRTLRTAAGAAALVAVVAAGAWVAKDRLPGATPQMADVSQTQRPAAPAAQTPPMMQVDTTPATGRMSAPQGLPQNLQAVNPSEPRIDNFASLDAAVAAGNPVAQLQKGLALLQTGEETQAATFIRASANQGLPAAQYYLGNLYESGRGVPADAAQARMLTERAARAGHRIAMYDLALYYIEGKGGVEADMAMAADWFAKAAQFGMTDAQYNLAVLYERGTGVTPDAGEAYSWYAIAGSQGDQDAARRAAQLETELPAQTLTRAQSTVASFTPSDFDPEVNGIFSDLPWNKNSRTGGDETVATVQRLLIDLGYDAGTADGAMGPRTREAIKAFERANGMPETGRVDEIIVQTLKDVAGA